jgi:two-component system OmpR family response regulator
MKKVLVVEDDRAIREMIAAALVEAGYAVAAAKNGREGLDRCRDFGPDVVILDLMMPQVDGFEFLKLRPVEGCDAPIIAMSAAFHRDRLPLDAPVSAFVEKPFAIDTFLETVAAHATASNGAARRRRMGRN